MITSRDLWAKLRRDAEGRVTGWHSLPHHSADVAAVLMELLRQPTVAARLARLAGRDGLDCVTVKRLGALAFLHDIGKANRGFRARVNPHAVPVGHINQVAWLFHSEAGSRHGDRMCDVLGTERTEAWFASEGSLEGRDAVFAHHGRPWERHAPPPSGNDWKPGPDGDPIADLAVMRRALDRWFPEAFAAGPPLPDAPAFWHAWAGLLMLADWLGSDSDETFFPFANGTGPDRMAFARQRAERAVATVGLASAPAKVRRRLAGLGFADTFLVGPPRPVQAAATVPGAACVVLEAETGSGKTEAALWRFKHLFEQGLVDGLYFALPTRVAATAMFGRIKAFRDRVFGGPSPPVVLAVPGQARVDDAEGRPLPGFGFEWNDARDNGESRARWAAEHPKRFLAASIAVGTVDQALLGAVRVRHAHLRGAALLRHLLVVDEVHASDRYMEALLSTLLRNHTGAGGHALLLSATLGAAARARLLGTACPAAAEAEAVPYPALSWAEGAAEARHEPERPAGASPAKHVTMETAPLLDRPDAIARLALDAAEAGGAVLVIRNTVAAAVATAQALEALAGPFHPALFRVQGVGTVHHGRFAAADRRLLDDAVEASLGKKRLPGGRVVAGTQTLEVSLDLDADLLLTDLCPADVLLQRIGRLHRHADRPRPPNCATPRAIVLVPAGRDLMPFAARSGGRHGLGLVYDDLRVIEATWREIDAMPEWSIPDDNRRLVERTTHPHHLNRIKDELSARDPVAWTRHVNGKEGNTSAELSEATSARLDWSVPFSLLHMDKDERVVTRLGTADRQADLPGAPSGPFGLPVTVLKIPHFLLSKDMPTDAEPQMLGGDGETLRFRMGPRILCYGRFGLRPEPT